MPLSDFLKTFLSKKWKKFPFTILEEEERKKYTGMYLLIVVIDRDVMFFNIHDSIDEAKTAFHLLVQGYWVGFTNHDSHAYIILYDLYSDKIIKEKKILYKNLSNKSKKSKEELENISQEK